MKLQFRLIIPAALAVAIILPATDQAWAQDHTWTLSLQGGLAAPLRGGGSSEAAFQAGFGVQFEPQGKMWVRAGQTDFTTGQSVGDLEDGTLTYLTVGGEYQFTEAFYESGIFIGLGAYDLDARPILADGVLGPREGDTLLGLVLAATGEFKITPSVVVLADISGHILDHDDLRVLGMFHIGIGFHF